MQSRYTLADRGTPWAAYIRQQLELGGPEVVLPGRSGIQALGRPGDPAAADAPVDVSASLDVRTPERPNVLPRWHDGAPPIPGPGLTIETGGATLLDAPNDPGGSLDAVAAEIAACTRCALAQGRSRTVPGEGDPRARLMLVGEGPGATEDATGRPFVGQAGQLLDKILEAIECPRHTVYIANIVKCRPPQNRKPLPDEVQACHPFLQRQIALVRPRVLVALGGTAAEGLLGVKKSLGELRNKVHRWNGIPLVVTYHPAALLRNPNWKKPTWDDVRIARQLLDS